MYNQLGYTNMVRPQKAGNVSYLGETDTLGKKNWLVLVDIRHDQQFTLDSVINKLLNSWHSQLGLTLT